MKQRRSTAIIVALSAMLAMMVTLGAPPAHAATVCTGDYCVVVNTLQTPLGVATISASATHVVTVQFAPTVANTWVFGIPFSIPPGPPNFFTRTSIATSGGLVSIDTFMIPPGPPGFAAFPNLAIISIHPPSPCRVLTSGTTVVFTPITT